jgi:hypothetical protein
MEMAAYWVQVLFTLVGGVLLLNVRRGRARAAGGN